MFIIKRVSISKPQALVSLSELNTSSKFFTLAGFSTWQVKSSTFSSISNFQFFLYKQPEIFYIIDTDVLASLFVVMPHTESK